MNILVSACLLGCSCRYDGASKPCPAVLKLMKKHTLIPVCPEQLGGLATPRPPSERKDGGVFTKAGADVTAQYENGARQALELARLYGCTCAVLKERSPACGTGEIYDGTFSRTPIPGDGVAAELLRKNGITVFGETQASGLL